MAERDPRLNPDTAHPLNAADVERSKARLADLELGMTSREDGAFWRDMAQRRVDALEEDGIWLGLMSYEEAELEQLKAMLAKANERLAP